MKPLSHHALEPGGPEDKVKHLKIKTDALNCARTTARGGGPRLALCIRCKAKPISPRSAGANTLQKKKKMNPSTALVFMP